MEIISEVVLFICILATCTNLEPRKQSKSGCVLLIPEHKKMFELYRFSNVQCSCIVFTKRRLIVVTLRQIALHKQMLFVNNPAQRKKTFSNE